MLPAHVLLTHKCCLHAPGLEHFGRSNSFLCRTETQCVVDCFTVGGCPLYAPGQTSVMHNAMPFCVELRVVFDYASAAVRTNLTEHCVQSK